MAEDLHVPAGEDIDESLRRRERISWTNIRIGLAQWAAICAGFVVAAIAAVIIWGLIRVAQYYLAVADGDFNAAAINGLVNGIKDTGSGILAGIVARTYWIKRRDR